MEAGVLRIWGRSMDTRNIRYTSVISDGDSKSVTKLNETKPYGEEVTIVKHE